MLIIQVEENDSLCWIAMLYEQLSVIKHKSESS